MFEVVFSLLTLLTPASSPDSLSIEAIARGRRWLDDARQAQVITACLHPDLNLRSHFESARLTRGNSPGSFVLTYRYRWEIPERKGQTDVAFTFSGRGELQSFEVLGDEYPTPAFTQVERILRQVALLDVCKSGACQALLDEAKRTGDLRALLRKLLARSGS